MAVNKKRDFKRLSLCIQDFLKRLPCNENTGFLRDTLYLSLLELHKYYNKEKERQNLSLQQTNETGKLAVVYEHTWKDVHNELDKYDDRWQECNDGGRFAAAIDGNVENLKKHILEDNHDMLGRSYLMYAINGSNSQQIETIQHILSLNFNINNQAHNGSTALHVACKHQKTSIATLLLKNKASVSLTDKKARSALHWAAKCQSTDLVKLLLQYGADINIQDCDGMTPAMWACYFNRTDNLHVLRNALERVDPRPEAILDEKDNVGRTVLHWAAMTCEQNSSFTCLKELLAVGDVCEIRDNQGRTVLHTAAVQGSISACQLILSTCHDDILNLKDNKKQTALHLATLCGHGEMVDFLLQGGANDSLENKNERTALQEAEIGHYHYCLLVFAAFDQMREKKESKSLVKSDNDVEMKTKEKRRYESWVIPSTSLNESHNFPTNSYLPQLVDVTEIEGFEINDVVVDTSQNNNVPDKPDDQKHSTEKRGVMTNNLAVTKDASVAATDKHDTSTATTGNPTTTIGQPPATSYNNITSSKNIAMRRSNKNALLQRSERVEGIKGTNEEKKDILHPKTDKTATFTVEGFQEEKLEGISVDDDEDDSRSENIEISSLIIESDDEKSESTSTDIDMKNEDKLNKETQIKMFSSSTEPNKTSTGNLTPIKPLQQPALTFPAKLDPIPVLRSNKKPPHVGAPQNDKHSRSLVASNSDQPRAIVAPLQPPAAHHKGQSGVSLSRDKLQHPSGPTYAARGPEHGPLAQTHSKKLLNTIFKENRNKISEQKTPELQRRGNHSGELSRPAVGH